MIKKTKSGWGVFHKFSGKKGIIKNFTGKNAEKRARSMHLAILISEGRIPGLKPKR